MHQIKKTDCQVRIFGKALQSALGPAFLSRRSPVASKENRKIIEDRAVPATLSKVHKPESNEMMAPRFKNVKDKEINGNGYEFPANHNGITNPSLQLSPPDQYFLVEDNQLASFQDPCSENLEIASMPTDYSNMYGPLFSEDQWQTNQNISSRATLSVETMPHDMHSWVENSRLASIQEAKCMVANNENDLWLKNNRLMALQHLGSDFHSQQFSSFGLTSSNCIDNLSGGISLGYLSDNRPCRISSCSSASSLSSEDSLKNVPVSDEYEIEMHERPAVIQQDGIKLELTRENFSSMTQMSSKENSSLPNQVNSVCKIDKNNEFQLYPEKKFQQKRIVKTLEPKSSRNCCEPSHCEHEDKNNVATLPSYDAASLMGLKSSTGFFDSHCHIDFLFDYQNFRGTYAGYMAQHKDTYPESYKGCIAVFCKPFTFAKKFLWQKILEQDKVWGAFGCHPKSARYYDDKIERDLERALNHPKVKALGEIGLDYSIGDESTKLEQHFVFRRQLRIAQKRNLRLVIHCRDADDDTIKIMHEVLPKDKIFHLHCFTGSWERAQKWIEEFPNVFIGITNLVTFPSAHKTHEVAREIPLERLLLETDAPYFVPKVFGKSTKYSHPGMAIHVAAQIAALKGIPVERVLQWTSANTRIVYDLP